MQKIETGHAYKTAHGRTWVVQNNLRCSFSDTPLANDEPLRAWPLSNADLKLLMGLPPKLPADGTDIMQIGNVKVYLVPQHLARMEKPGRNRPHRLMACCPKCNYIIPAGRLQQHLKAHK